jgi:putative serine/threonine protein kinase
MTKRFVLKKILENRKLDIPLVKIVSYPKYDTSIARYRLSILYSMGVSAIISEGTTIIDQCRILGKGMNSMVLKIIYKNKVAVVKLLRLDAQRTHMYNEANVLKYINKYGLGPKLYTYYDWFIIEEFIDGHYLPIVLENLITKRDIDNLKLILKRVFEKAYNLDRLGVNHGELSRAEKHIIISKNLKPRIIDFESSSMIKRPKNLTSILQYIFIRFRGGTISDILGIMYDELIPILNKYKASYDEDMFKLILQKVSIE